MKMEAAWPSKPMVFYHITVQSHNPEDHNMNLHHHENLKSHNLITKLFSVIVNHPHI